MSKPLLAALLGAFVGGVLVAMMSSHNQQENAARAASICGLGAFSIATITDIFSRWGTNISEYEKERDQLEHAFLEKECTIITEASLFDKEYIKAQVQTRSATLCCLANSKNISNGVL